MESQIKVKEQKDYKKPVDTTKLCYEDLEKAWEEGVGRITEVKEYRYELNYMSCFPPYIVDLWSQ